MERYLVFCYSTYYPEGGMNDCKLKTDDEQDALVFAAAKAYDGGQVHILDTQTGKTKAIID